MHMHSMTLASALLAVTAGYITLSGSSHCYAAEPNPVSTAESPHETGCPTHHLDYTISFKGGTTEGEEITVRLDTHSHLYEITIDKGVNANRHPTLYKGPLVRNPGDCHYLLSGQNTTPIRVDPRGVVIGRLKENGLEVPPTAFIAFRHISTEFTDLSGDWVVSGREHSFHNNVFSKRIPIHEMRVLPDGRFKKCETLDEAGNIRCVHGAGRFAVQGPSFRLIDKREDDTSLILGKVNDVFVPILLKRGTSGHGMRIFMPRKSREHTQASVANSD